MLQVQAASLVVAPCVATKIQYRLIHAATYLLNPPYELQIVKQHRNHVVIRGWKSYCRDLLGEDDEGLKATRALNHELEKYQLGLESFREKQAAMTDTKYWKFKHRTHVRKTNK